MDILYLILLGPTIVLSWSAVVFAIYDIVRRGK